MLHFHLGNAYRAIKEFENARTSHENADKLVQKSPAVRKDVEFYWDLTISLARDYQALSQHNEAIEICQRLEAHCESQPDPKKLGVFHRLLADLYVLKFIELSQSQTTPKDDTATNIDGQAKCEVQNKHGISLKLTIVTNGSSKNSTPSDQTKGSRTLEAEESFEKARHHYRCYNENSKNPPKCGALNSTCLKKLSLKLKSGRTL